MASGSEIRLPSDLEAIGRLNPELMEVMAEAALYAREAGARGRAARSVAWDALVAEGVSGSRPAGDALPSLRLVSSLSEDSLVALARDLEVPVQDDLRKTAWVVHDALAEGFAAGEEEAATVGRGFAAGPGTSGAAPASEAPAAPVRAKPAGIPTTRDARNTRNATLAAGEDQGGDEGTSASASAPAYPPEGLPSFAPEFAPSADHVAMASSMRGRVAIVPRPGQQRRARAGRAAAAGAAAAPSPSAPPEHGLTGADAARTLAEAGANNVVVLDVRGACPFADEIVVCEGRSQRVCRAAAGAVVGLLRQRRNEAVDSIARRLRGEGVERVEGDGGMSVQEKEQTRDVAPEDADETLDEKPSHAADPADSAASASRAVSSAPVVRLSQLSPAELEERLEALEAFVPRVEGQEDGTEWLVVDGGRVVCHVFTDESRKEFDLEGIWTQKGGENVTLRIEEGSRVLTLRNIK